MSFERQGISPARESPHRGEAREDILRFLTLSCLAIVLVPALATAALLLIGQSPSQSPFQIGEQVLLCGVIAVLGWRYLRCVPARSRLLTLLAFAVLIAFALLTACWSWDVTWDGVTYHAEAILGLIDGVNPIYGSFQGNFPQWTNHYPKTLWYFAAAIGGALHQPEAGRSWNTFLLAACLFYSGRFFRSLGLERHSAWLLAACTALNPVACSQILSFYVDGAMASLMSMMLLAAASLLRRRESFDWLIFAVTASAAATIKFTGAAYSGVTVALTLGALVMVNLRSERAGRWLFLRPAALSLALTGVLVLLLGFSPYVTHLEQGRSLFYPVTGAGKTAVITDDLGPGEFFRPGRNRFENLAVSLFSRSGEISGAARPVLKVPLTVYAQEIRDSTMPDLRVAGWGIFFSGILLLSLGAFVRTKGWRHGPAISFVLLAIPATSFTNPHAWWARLTPQIALLPVMLLVPAFLDGKAGMRRFAALTAYLYLLNSMLLLGLAVQSSLRGTLRARHCMRLIAEQCGPGTWRFDGDTTLVRYDLLPPAYGVVIQRAVNYKPASGDRHFLLYLVNRDVHVDLTSSACRRNSLR